MERELEKAYRYAGIPELYLGKPYNKQNSPEAYNQAREYFLEFLGEKSKGLIITGNSGTGKSHLASYLTQCLCKQSIKPKFVNSTSMINDLRMEKYDRNNYIKDYQFAMSYCLNAEYLIIDDLGSEQTTQETQLIHFQIIDYRIRNKKPFCITSNKSIKREDLKQSSILKAIDYRTLSRILEVCTVIEMNGNDMRLNKTTGANK